jgi:hypothetical protein
MDKMAEDKKQDRTPVIGPPTYLVVPPSKLKCGAFDFCIQPHICEASGMCIWNGQPRERNADDGEQD